MDPSRSPLELEILAEQAHSLARATRLLEASLLALARASAAARPGPRPQGPGREALLQEACERLWEVIVQREAMGITLHDILYEVLRVPAEVRAGMGRRARPAAAG